MIIPFNKPVMPNDFNDILSKTIRDGWLTTGPVVNIFEERLKEYLNSENVVAVNSCTAALHLAIAAFQYDTRDKFIAPTYTFVATVEAGEYLGLNPVLIDSDENHNIDLNQIEDVLKKDNKIKCIIPVHFGGMPVDMESLNFLEKSMELISLKMQRTLLNRFQIQEKLGILKMQPAFHFMLTKI